MNGCDACKHANWKRTTNGRLHPDKTGRCGFIWNPPPIPLAYSAGTFAKNGQVPTLTGGYIGRSDPMYDNCPCFESSDTPQIGTKP